MADPATWDPARPGAAAPGLSVYDEALGAAICARVRAGETLSELCREPGMPHRTTVQGWRAAHPDFDVELRQAFAVKRLGERLRDRQALAERRAAEAARPPPRKGGRASSYTTAQGELICARLAEGESLTAIGRDPDMPCYGTILAWVKRHPEFEAMYETAREVQANYLFDEARDVALAATRETLPVARLQFDVIRWQAARLSPKKYSERVMAWDHRAEAARQAAEAARRPVETHFYVTRWEIGPNGKMLAIPPRNAAEEQAWLEAYGTPYAPGTLTADGVVKPPVNFGIE